MSKYLYFLLVVAATWSGCSYTMKIQTGEMAVERKQYAKAVTLLKKEYEKSDSRVEKGKLAYLMGTSYDALNQGADALSWYKIAYDNQYGADALKQYAFALKQSEQYTEAAGVFRELGLEIGSPYEYRKEIQACEAAAGWAAEKRKAFSVESLAANSGAADYAPSLYGTGQQLLITSDRAGTLGKDTYQWTGKAFSDLFILDPATQTVQPLPPSINTPDNEGTGVLTPDGNTLYFTRCAAPKGFDAYCRILRSTRASNDTWSEPQPLPFQTAGVNYMHPALSADGNTLYFSANHPDGWGGFDIYSTTRKGSEWDTPKVLSRSVNSTGDEQFPALDADTLYFASTGHTGMGGLDVFRSSRLASGEWAPPINLKTPINSGSDDFGFVVDRRAHQPNDGLMRGYFTSRRGDVGGDDIYAYQQQRLAPEPEPEVQPNFKNTLDVYVLEKIYENPTNPNSRVLGRKPLVGAQLTIRLGRDERTVAIGEDGKISISLQDNARYNFLATREGYLNNDATFSSTGLPKDSRQPEQLYELEIVLDKIFRDQEIVLENIYYDYDKWFIRYDAQPTLMALAQLLQKNPNIRIQLGSHTDCRGSDDYNEQLSLRRAEAAVDFLVEKGIDIARLSAKGYGESAPVNTCLCNRCTEDEHQQNRRTTFKIVD